MEIRDIILYRISDKKVAPVLILIDEGKNIIGLQVSGLRMLSEIKEKLQKKCSKIEKDNYKKAKKTIEETIVIIGQPYGLKYESCIRVNREIIIDSKKIITIISKVNDEHFNEITDKYKKYKKKQMLHKELHILKNKILVAKFNNQDYKEYELRLYDILKELGYNENTYKKYKDNWYRDAPSKGNIKIYLGGR